MVKLFDVKVVITLSHSPRWVLLPESVWQKSRWSSLNINTRLIKNFNLILLFRKQINERDIWNNFKNIFMYKSRFISFFHNFLTCRSLGAIQQGCVYYHLRIPSRVSVQAAKSHIQNANLSPKCWWEGKHLVSLAKVFC